jgi:hypothetical protein
MVVSKTTAECSARFVPMEEVVQLHIPSYGCFNIAKSLWSVMFGGGKSDPSWVHIMAEGLSNLNSCCCFAFKRHWIKNTVSQKKTSALFKANAYCTFETCNIVAVLSVNNLRLQDDQITVHVHFNGTLQHRNDEIHARRISYSARQKICERFQETNVAPAKEYHTRLMQLGPEQYAFGNRDGVGCSLSVLQKVSSDARLQLQEDRDLIMSLLLLKKKLIALESANVAGNIKRKKSPVKGFIQHVHASPFSVICFNEAAVRLYHEIAKQGAVFCDATGTIVSLPKDEGKVPTVYYYAIVLKHPTKDKPPIAVAELITSDHTVLSISYFLESFRRAEGILFSQPSKPQQIIIDRSQVLLLSFLHVYNAETLQEYLLRAFRIVTGTAKPQDAGKISPHACKSHVMNSAKRECKKW